MVDCVRLRSHAAAGPGPIASNRHGSSGVFPAMQPERTKPISVSVAAWRGLMFVPMLSSTFTRVSCHAATRIEPQRLRLGFNWRIFAMKHGRIVVHDMQGALVSDRALHGGFNLGRLGHVAGDELGSAAGRADHLNRLVAAFDFHVGDHHSRTPLWGTSGRRRALGHRPPR